MASHDLTLKDYQKQLKDNVKSIYENYTDLLRTRTEHLNFEVTVKSAEIVRSYQSLMTLVADIRSYLIINDLISLNQNVPGTPSQSRYGNQHPSGPFADNDLSKTLDDKLVKLRDDMAVFLYELEIPLP